jgi:hypothetical protein
MNLLAEGNTFDAEKLSAGFFRILPQDQRYVALYRHPQNPITAITQQGAEFRFPPST